MESIRPRERAADTFGASLLEAAMRDAQGKMTRERATAHGLTGAAITIASIVAARGVLAVARPSAHAAPHVAAALVVALLVAAALVAFALRAHRRRERLATDLERLMLARASLDPDRAPGIARPGDGPYRVGPPDGSTSLDALDTSPPSAPLDAQQSPVAPSSRRRTSTFARMAGGATLVGALAAGASALHANTPAIRRWTFADGAPDPAALGFVAGDARGGRWELASHRAATGARALVNYAGDDAAPPATLRSEAMRARDLRASTRCKVSEASKGGCGLVFRFVDAKNHVVARLDAAEGRVVLASLSGDEERILGSVPGPVEPGVWQEIAIEARGDHLRVLCNGSSALDVIDPTPARLGSVGVWAAAEAEAYFDELEIEVLPASAQALEVLLLRKGAS